MAEQKNTQNKQGNNKQQPPKPPFPGMKNPKGGFNIFWLYGLLAVVLIAINFGDFGASKNEITDKEFFNKLNGGEIEKIVVVNKDFVEVYTNSGSEGGGSAFGIEAPDHTLNIDIDYFFDRFRAGLI